MDNLTLDQYRVFTVVAAEGSFAAAARRLNRAQSAITYTLQKLEGQCGFLLFDRSTYRPHLTVAGRTLLPHAQRVVDDSEAFSFHALGLTQGLEAQLSLALDEFTPMRGLAMVLSKFHARFPSVQVHLTNVRLGTVCDVLKEGKVDIGIANEMSFMRGSVNRNVVGPIGLLPVATPGHPLAKIKGPIKAELLRDHVQVILTRGDTSPADTAFGIHSVNRWYVTDLSIKKVLIVNGMGWGSLPHHMIAMDILAGHLVELDVARWEGSDQLPKFNLSVAWRSDRPLGPSAAWLREQLSSASWMHDNRGNS